MNSNPDVATFCWQIYNLSKFFADFFYGGLEFGCVNVGTAHTFAKPFKR